VACPGAAARAVPLAAVFTSPRFQQSAGVTRDAGFEGEERVPLGRDMQLPLNVSAPETGETATVGARKKSRRHMAVIAAPWKEEGGVAAIVLFWFCLQLLG